MNARDALRLPLSLRLGFTLAMVLPQFDQRRQAILGESVSIATIYLRAQLLPEAEKDRVQRLLKEYVSVRLQFPELRIDTVEYQWLGKRSRELQSELWEQAVAAGQKAPNPVVSLFVNSLNETITAAGAESERRKPGSGLCVDHAFVIALLASFAAGYSASRRIWLAFLMTPIMVAIVMWLTADMEWANSHRCEELAAGGGATL